jgi:hypothetical protein
MKPSINTDGLPYFRTPEPQHIRFEELQEKHDTLTVRMGYALESIRQLVGLAVATGHDKATAVKVAQRFLADMEGAK